MIFLLRNVIRAYHLYRVSMEGLCLIFLNLPFDQILFCRIFSAKDNIHDFLSHRKEIYIKMPLFSSILHLERALHPGWFRKKGKKKVIISVGIVINPINVPHLFSAALGTFATKPWLWGCPARTCCAETSVITENCFLFGGRKHFQSIIEMFCWVTGFTPS